MNIRSLDWKFIVSILIGLVGGIGPLLWQANQEAKALKVEIVALTALIPDATPIGNGLKITIDDQLVADPYLSVIELTNEGSHPITQSDFEGPIEILSQEAIRIIRATTTELSPPDLRPTFSVKSNIVALSPLLLNPKDKIQATILSAGGRPTFTTRSRIAGISNLEVSDRTESSSSMRVNWLQVAVGFFLTVIYVGAGFHVWGGLCEKRFLPMPTFVAVISWFGGYILLTPIYQAYSFGFIQTLFVYIIAAIISTPYTWPLLGKHRL